MTESLDLSLDLESVDLSLDGIEEENNLDQYIEEANNKASSMTDFTVIENQRVVLGNNWIKGTPGTFKWNEPGKQLDTENPENSLEDVCLDSNYTRIGGVILSAEIKPGLGIEGSNSSKDLACQVIGYKEKQYENGELSQERFVKALPNYPVLLSMFQGWDKENNRPNYRVPNPTVTNMELVGSRGKLCKDCIKGGLAFNDDKECTPYGRLYFYCTHLGTNSKLVKVSDLYPGQDGIVLIISMPHKIALKGLWDRDDEKKRRIGFMRYLTDIFNRKNESIPRALKNPEKLFTMISIKSPVNKPGSNGIQNSMNYLHFEYKMQVWDAKNRGMWEGILSKARETWDEINPNSEKEELDMETAIFESSNEPEVVYSDDNDNSTINENSFDDSEEEEILLDDSSNDKWGDASLGLS